MRFDDLEQLRCPDCRGRLAFEGAEAGGRLEAGTLRCAGCAATWPVREGLPRLYREETVRGTDRLMRYIYDNLWPLHDPAVHWLLPVLGGGTERQLREGYMPRIGLQDLQPRADGRPLRILEVSVGAGANLALVRRDLPAGLPFEFWGCDLSRGMLRDTERKLPRAGLGDVRLLMCDAHALPFPDASFDRVFHVGGIGGFRDPGRALREMARVAVPGTPIVVVDENLDPAARRNPYYFAMFRAITFYDRDPHCPRECLPDGAIDVTVEQVTRYYYSMTFRMPG